MNNCWSNDLQKLTPYAPGESDPSYSFIKLNTNENPYGPSEKSLRAIRDVLGSQLRLYPDSDNIQLKKTIAKFHQLEPENVFVGNGSDEVLAHIFRGLFKKNDPILFPDITYSFYPSYCNLFGIDFRRVELDEKFRIKIDSFVCQSGGIIFPNPNAPTGIFVDVDHIKSLLNNVSSNCPVVIDEAYIDFGGVSVVPLVSEYPNLIVTRTLSKSHSLAGIRLGYAIADKNIIQALKLVKNSFNSYPVDSLAEAGAIAALNDREHFLKNCGNIIANRSYLISKLEKIGFNVLPALGNFVCARLEGVDGALVAEKLKYKGILVRHFKTPERLSGFVRITVGKMTDCQTLVSSLTHLFSP